MYVWSRLESFVVDCTSLKNARAVVQNQVLGMIQSVQDLVRNSAAIPGFLRSGLLDRKSVV